MSSSTEGAPGSQEHNFGNVLFQECLDDPVCQRQVEGLEAMLCVRARVEAAEASLVETDLQRTDVVTATRFCSAVPKAVSQRSAESDSGYRVSEKRAGFEADPAEVVFVSCAAPASEKSADAPARDRCGHVSRSRRGRSSGRPGSACSSEGPLLVQRSWMVKSRLIVQRPWWCMVTRLWVWSLELILIRDVTIHEFMSLHLLVMHVHAQLTFLPCLLVLLFSVSLPSPPRLHRCCVLLLLLLLPMHVHVSLCMVM